MYASHNGLWVSHATKYYVPHPAILVKRGHHCTLCIISCADCYTVCKEIHLVLLSFLFERNTFYPFICRCIELDMRVGVIDYIML